MNALVVTVLDYEGVGGGGLGLERYVEYEKTLVVTVLDLNGLGLERHVEYEDVGGDGLGL